jgi:hypothetical protein
VKDSATVKPQAIPLSGTGVKTEVK